MSLNAKKRGGWIITTQQGGTYFAGLRQALGRRGVIDARRQLPLKPTIMWSRSGTPRGHRWCFPAPTGRPESASCFGMAAFLQVRVPFLESWALAFAPAWVSHGPHWVLQSWCGPSYVCRLSTSAPNCGPLVARIRTLCWNQWRRRALNV